MHMQMLMKCLCNDLGVLVHACDLSWAPPIALLYFLLHGVIAPACTRGYMQLWQGHVQWVATGQGPTASAPYG